MELERLLKEDPEGVAKAHKAAAKRTQDMLDLQKKENEVGSVDAATTDDMHVGKGSGSLERNELGEPVKPASVVIDPKHIAPTPSEPEKAAEARRTDNPGAEEAEDDERSRGGRSSASKHKKGR